MHLLLTFTVFPLLLHLHILSSGKLPPILHLPWLILQPSEVDSVWTVVLSLWQRHGGAFGSPLVHLVALA